MKSSVEVIQKHVGKNRFGSVLHALGLHSIHQNPSLGLGLGSMPRPLNIWKECTTAWAVHCKAPRAEIVTVCFKASRNEKSQKERQDSLTPGSSNGEVVIVRNYNHKTKWQ
jgi:hypothetical protein